MVGDAGASFLGRSVSGSCCLVREASGCLVVFEVFFGLLASVPWLLTSQDRCMKSHRGYKRVCEEGRFDLCYVSVLAC
jgi:hypothetical protein